MIILYFLSLRDRKRMLQLTKIGNKGEQLRKEKNVWVILFHYAEWDYDFNFLLSPSIYAHIHDYTTISKMCLYDEFHLNSSYKTANVVDNLTKINTKNILSFGSWIENCNHLLRILNLSFFTHIPLIFCQPVCTNRSW